MPSKKHRRYKLLLDEGLHLPVSYPNLNSLHNLLHISQTKNRGISDQAVYRLANTDKRILVVFNTKHFKPLIAKDTMSVIALSTNLSDHQADLKITKALKNLTPSQTTGHIIFITNSGVRKRKVTR